MLAKPLRSVEATTSYILSLSIKLIVQILLSFLLIYSMYSSGAYRSVVSVPLSEASHECASALS